jgi:RNA polymerase sigma factor (sigma-70 family)
VSLDDAERAWVLRAQAGSADAFGRLVDRHQQALRLFLRRLAPGEADDIAQEAFVFAWDHIGRFDGGRPFRPWLFGIAWRKYRESRRGWLRRLLRDGQAAERDDGAPADPGGALDLTSALAKLPDAERAALILCLVQEFTHAEAAEALALPLGTIKSHVARGRERLAAMLGDAHG